MRSLVILAFSIAVGAGACGSHSLTGDISGTGGAGTGGVGTGAGATGGSSTGGTGGAGGSLLAACTELASQYQQALPAAMACDVGASGQCAQIVESALSACGSCPIAVSDTSTLGALRKLWDGANCQGAFGAISCPLDLCLQPDKDVCLPVDGGTRGVCSYPPAGTGGSSGAGGDGGVSACGALAAKYAAVLASAKSCTAGSADQCAHAVPARLSPCRDGCVEYVNDPTELSSIEQAWTQQGCANAAVACPAYACAPTVAGACVATDGGGAVCGAVYSVPL